MSFSALQVGKTKMTGRNDLGESVKTEYCQKKTALVEKLGGQGMIPQRAKYLTYYNMYHGKRDGPYPMHISTYGSFFAMEATMPNIPLTQVRILAVTGILPVVQKENLSWKLSLTWSRFDGDTLTGKIKGVLEGSN
jgi:hypothetical protein